MKAQGTLKFYVPISKPHPLGMMERLKQVHAEVCGEDEADKQTVVFVKANPRLPVVRVTWQPWPKEISLNFTR